MATRQRTPNAMDLLLGAMPRPASTTATSSVEPASAEPAVASADAPAPIVAAPQPDHAPMALLEEMGEMELASTGSVEPGEGPAPELPAPIFSPQKSSVVEVVAVEAPSDGATEPMVATEPGLTSAPAVTSPTSTSSVEPAPRARRRRSQAPTPVAVTTTVAPVVETNAAPPAVVVEPKAAPAVRRRRDPDEDLEPAYVPIKVTVSIPAVVLSELIRTVQTIRRMTGRRQPVNQGTVIAAALEMAFEEFRTKGATSQLVDKLRIE